MANFVLVPGAWHGAWCWELVIPRLEALSHHAVAVDLETELDVAPEEVLDVWAAQVAAHPAVMAGGALLVGHSRGGLVISRAAEIARRRPLALAYVTALLAPAGSSYADLVQRLDTPPAFLDAVEVSADGRRARLRPEAAARLFYQLTPPALAARASELLSEEPIGATSLPLQVTEQRYGVVPRAYVECARDCANPIALQQLMQDLSPCGLTISLDCDHSPFYSAPDELARALDEIARWAAPAVAHRPWES